MLFFSEKQSFICKQKVNCFSDQSPNGIVNTRTKRAPYATSQLKASMTLEAALVLPIFIYALIVILFFIQIIQMQIHIQKALYNQAMKMSGRAYYLTLVDTEESVEHFLEAEYIKYAVIDEVGRDYLDNSYIIGGANGIILNITGEAADGVVDVALEYRVKAPFDIFGLKKLNFVSRARCHTWVGVEEKEEGEEEKGEVAYVTSNPSVYHTHSDCTYLKKQVNSSDYSAIENLRNSSGAKYYACQSCIGNRKVNTVYYTSYGTRYHGDKNCKNIHTNVYTIKLSKAKEKYPLCSKCEKKGNK